ncbi:alpha/beta fold hydrolase [Amycolatopsis speibonae]|uniref:Alpha/beta fold hydrolase n=1 Tax=Amycolatopsis speibonae TaxID=1450224 RepID=A0ABV7P2M3_9PSEU
MPFVTANGVELHVQRQPRPGAPVVVLVHGLADSLASFYFTLTGPLAEAGFDVISYDLRGHGRSERPPTGYTLLNSGEDLAALLDALGVDRPVHLVGYSLGTTIAISFAHRHPGRVADIAMIEGEPPTKAWANRMTDALARADAVINDAAFMAEQDEVAHKAAARGRELAAHTTAMTDSLDPSGLLSPDQVRAVTHPKLLILGEQSDLALVRAELEDLLTTCETRVIPGQTHLLLADAPLQVRALLVPWLTERSMR